MEAAATLVVAKIATFAKMIVRNHILNVKHGKEEDEIQQGTDDKEKVSEALFKIVDNLVIVAALITTASFAAGFTLPGGLHSNDDSKQAGTPFLLRKAAFQAFVVTNAISFSCSSAVLLLHFLLIPYRGRYDEASNAVKKFVDGKIMVMYITTGVALVAMVIAFVTGVYAVLTPTLGLAIPICVIPLVIIILLLRA